MKAPSGPDLHFLLFSDTDAREDFTRDADRRGSGAARWFGHTHQRTPYRHPPPLRQPARDLRTTGRTTAKTSAGPGIRSGRGAQQRVDNLTSTAPVQNGRFDPAYANATMRKAEEFAMVA